MLVLAPRGRDAAVISKVLKARQIGATECATAKQMVELLDQGAAGAVLTDDSVAGDHLEHLKRWLGAQPAWSDFPFIVLTARRAHPSAETAVDLLHTLGNFILLERPVHADTLARAAASALRARLRQYETRDTLEQLTDARASVQLLNQELEGRIASRTEALAAANDRLMLEISERERAQANLVHVQKLEAVGRLTGGIAHDFNNLLQVVNMNIDLLIRRASDPKLSDLASKAKRAVGRGRKLTGQLLSFARTQSLLPKSTELNALIAEMQELIAVSIGSRVELELKLCAEPAWATIDAAQLEMALLNLAVNAKDAMPNGGTLTIATRFVEGPCHELSSHQHVVVSATDTGTGIPEPLLAKVFEPFFTTKPVGSGTGLGLSQVYGFARQSGGLARVESEPDQGTTVELWFPAMEGSPLPVGTPAKAQESTAFMPRQVLVIEDEPEVRRVIVESLSMSGHVVRSAATGAEGLELIRHQRPDVLVVDYAMPGMNGAEVIAEVRILDSSMPILLATGYADMAEVARVLPATSVLLKPFDITALLRAVDDACAVAA